MRFKLFILLFLGLFFNFISSANAFSNGEKQTVRVAISNQNFSTYEHQNAKISSDEDITIIDISQENTSSKINTVLEAIGRSDPVIFLIHGINQSGMETKFTRGGHFIVVDGYVQDGVARIMDPGSTSDERKWANIYDAGRNGLFTGAKQVWIFKQGVK